LQLQADTQTAVTMLCLAGLHVLDKKNKNKIKNVGKETLKNVKTWQKNVETFLHLYSKYLRYFFSAMT